MSTAMLNVRLDKALKSEGDRVLAKLGISATEAVRSLYRFLEKNKTAPDFCIEDAEIVTPEERREKMRQLVGIAPLGPGEDLVTLKQERLARKIG